MNRPGLTGSRIRERRIMAGLRQSELAARAGISSSYLNLIEHNRRRIGGKLLLDISAVLKVEPSLLSDGADVALVAALRNAAEHSGVTAEMAQPEEFAGRFPRWAELLVNRQRRVEVLEHVVETLTDRLTHDPHLARSLHEVLSTVTAIRSTAGILVDTKALEPEWRDRFQRNINEDSKRLAESSRALVNYLDNAGESDAVLSLPQDEVQAFLAAHEFHFPRLEDEPGADPAEFVAQSSELKSSTSRKTGRQLLERYRRDAVAMPLAPLLDFIAAAGVDLMALAQRFDVDLATVMRRLAMLPPNALPDGVGLVICDASGSITHHRPLDGFHVPRIGAACALWPLYQALNAPMRPIARRLVQAGRGEEVFQSYAIALPIGMPGFDEDALFEAHMLILPLATPTQDREAVRLVGASCHICPKPECVARREPSIMHEGF